MPPRSASQISSDDNMALQFDFELCMDVGRKIPLPHLGLEPALVLRLAFQPDALPAELFPPLMQANTATLVLTTNRSETIC